MPWLALIPYALTFLGTAGLAFWLHSADVDKIEMRHRDALEAQQRADTEQCTKTIKAAEANNEKYETSLNTLNDSYDHTVSALGLCKRETIRLRSDAATSRVSQANTAGRLVHGDAADVGNLLAYSRKCRDLQLRLISADQAWPQSK